jgi:2'-5' RNA ligase
MIVEHSVGTYAKVLPDEQTKSRIANILDLFNIENAVCANDVHVTVVYSHNECSDIENISVPLPIKASGAELAIFKNFDGSNCLVVKLASEGLHSLHNKCRTEFFATHDYPSFQPHITLSYDFSSDKVPQGPLLEHFHTLYFNEYVVEPLDISYGI